MLVSSKELKNLKLSGIKVSDLKDLANEANVDIKGKTRAGDIIKSCVESGLSQEDINHFIKLKYQSKVLDRQNQIMS